MQSSPFHPNTLPHPRNPPRMSAPNAPRKASRSPFMEPPPTPIRIRFEDTCVPNAPRKRQNFFKSPISFNLNYALGMSDENDGYDSPVPTKKTRVCPGAPMRPCLRRWFVMTTCLDYYGSGCLVLWTSSKATNNLLFVAFKSTVIDRMFSPSPNTKISITYIKYLNLKIEKIINTEASQ